MFNTMKIAALSAVVGFGALTAVPAFAQERGADFGFGGRGGIHTSRDGQSFRHDDRRDVRGCTPARALDKARRMGIHRARIDDVSRRTITVRGQSRSGRILLTFARAPRCPVIS